MRLLARGGRLRVAEELDRLSPQEFSEWVAFEQLEGDPWRRLAEILKLGFATLAQLWGGDVRFDDFDPDKKRRRKTAPLVSPGDAARLMRANYGG
jgi:hypothetical protein